MLSRPKYMSAAEWKCEKTIKTGSPSLNGGILDPNLCCLNPTSLFCLTVHHSKCWINHLKITRRFFWSLLLPSFHKWNGNYVLIVIFFKFADAAHRQQNVFLKSWNRKRLILNALSKHTKEKVITDKLRGYFRHWYISCLTLAKKYWIAKWQA